ncbi:MAG: hypothetical protein H8K06_06150 [Nitrospira sp.]|uniref:Uncharacterized protein n=1 Tax=Nitrospira defluvii TaxID=330214 RepID=A0ABN7M9I8_9BACT|nr:hypothetical protein [Nitrospira defluvii]MCS6326656.1 hypothetical protein [Nitrospira sp.]CAE6785704.1 conserved exported hypothetical protein [Nitrospira defluvii]
MKASATIRRQAVAATLALCALSGCAVLTVDVDVYKGALVNEEHVQLHQLVALTTAAQPMLVHLRDNLEWPETEGKPPKGATTYPGNYSGDCERKQWTGSWYEMGHVKAPEGWVSEAPKPWWRAFWDTLQEGFRNPLCRPHFKNPYARAVNNVLSLYDDLADSDLGPHARKLRQAVEQLRTATSDPEKDQAIYVELASGFKPDTALTREGLLNLKQGYRELLVSSSGSEVSRKVGPLMDALKELWSNPKAIKKQVPEKKPKEIEADLLSKWERTDTYLIRNEIFDRRLPFRAVWKFLGEGVTDTFLAEVTRELCPQGREGDSACGALLKRTQALADEYWKSRRAVRDIWLESLGLLIDIERLRRDNTKVYDDLKNKVIRLVVEVTNVRHIASALDRLDREGQCSLLRNPLSLGLFCEVGKDSQPIWSENNVRKQLGYFEEVLRRNLSSSPADTAHFLLYLDSLESTAPQKNSIGNVLVEAANKVNPQRLVRLGLNRSFIEDRKLEGSPELFDFVDDVSRKVAQGFERGRLPDGLHTLTEAFLKSHNGNTHAGDSHEEEKLLDALVEFAQKLLFLANHEGLSSPPGTSGLILGGAEKINRGLFGDSLTDAGLYGIFGSGLAENRKQQYVRVLQAVGNSILFSANELRERERYRDQSKGKVQAEVAAVRAAYSPDPVKILSDLLHELRREQVIAQNQLGEATAQKAAIDGQIGSSNNPKSGLRLAEDTALNERNKAEQDLANYVTKQGQQKAIHDVLTQEVIAKIKAQWKSSGTGAAADVTAFMTGSHGIEQELTTVRQALDGIPTPVETHNFDEGVKYVKSPEAKAAFEAYRTINGHTSFAQAELLDAFAAHLRELEAARAARVTQYEKSIREKAQAVVDVQEKIAKMEAESVRLATVIAALPNTKIQLITAATVIEALRAEVLDEAAQHDRFVSPDAMYLLLATHVKRKEDAESDVSKKQPYQVALDVLSRRTPPPGLPPPNPTDYKSPLAVMDDVIALLRHRQMMAVERFGKGSDEDKKATEALENAYQHRAGMVYIRPSSAYLRTSFPSTSLQDDPNLAWDNMLLKQGIRNLPFSSQLRDILDPSVERDRILTAELDKQYWQNINRVRVSGAGFTNQALVKDDVGNWYVKQYFGDTEKIVKSAKHVALYSLGTKLPIDLSDELRKAFVTKEGSKKTEAEKEAELPPLRQVFGKHKAAYQAYIADTATQLVALHGRDNEKTLYAQILAAWKGDAESSTDADPMKALTVALEEEVAQWDTTLGPLKEASDQDRGLAIRKDLRALAKFEKQLSARIQKLDKQEALKTKAAKEVHKVVGRILIGLLEGHKQALDRYEQAVLFIGDAANPKDPKQEQEK